MGFPQIRNTISGVPTKGLYNIRVGSGSPCQGKLPRSDTNCNDGRENVLLAGHPTKR